MRRDLVVAGAGGLARELAMLAQQIDAVTHRWRFLGFVDASRDHVGEPLGDSVIIGDDDWLEARQEPTDVVVGMGHPRVRAAVARRLARCDALQFPTLVHPRVETGQARVELGIGNALTAGVILTCDIVIGDFNVLNLNTTIGHDVTIGSFDVINPGANISGGAIIGDEVLVGTGAQILEGVRIGHQAVVGAGAVVVRDVPEGTTVVGVPARPLKTEGEGDRR